MSVPEPVPAPHGSADPDVEARVRDLFERQRLLGTVGARLGEVAPGSVEIELIPAVGLTQQHGYVHAGAVTSIVDTACGLAAYSLMPPGSGVLSVEFKVNLLAPAAGDRLVARGRVVRAGRTLTVTQGDVVALTAGEEGLVATMVATMMNVGSRRSGGESGP